MKSPIYTLDQLLRLRESPLVQKPDNLPPIEQWIGSVDTNLHRNDVVSSYPSRQSAVQRHPRAQGATQNGKIDDGESPVKRPSLFETRHMSRHSKDGASEDIFLGPKISFASASAARQPTKNGAADDRSSTQTPDDSRNKTDRGVTRERGFRDREGKDSNADRFRERLDRATSHQENGSTSDFKSQLGMRRAVDSYSRTTTRMEDGEEAMTDEGEQKRNVISRAKLDQPWFRAAEKSDAKDTENAPDTTIERSWRDKDRRGEKDWGKTQRVEQDPQWMSDASNADMTNHTQDDFQKWKERMKASSSATDDKSTPIQEDTPDSGVTPTPMTPIKDFAQDNDKPDDMFKLWIEPKRDDLSFEAQSSTPKGTSKPKSSRFAGFFGPAQQEAPRPPPITEPISPPAISPAKTSSEDQEGFRRMMEMLRMAGPTAQAQPTQTSTRLPLESQHVETQVQSGAWLGKEKENRSSEAQQLPRQTTIPLSQPVPSQQLRSQQQVPKPAPRPEPVSRDSEFLLKLMQQQFQQPRSPFTDGQIYGQSYNRKDTAETSNLLNSFTQKHQQQPQMQPLPQVQSQVQGQKQRGPPPGFFGNERAFSGNHQIESQILPEHMANPSAMDDRMSGTVQRPLSLDQRFQLLPTFDQLSPPSSRVLPPTNEQMPPPPGFSAGMQGPTPPGFFAFPGGNSNISHQHTSGPPNMRGPMPPPQPPGFFHAQASGAVPGHGHSSGFSLQQQQQQLQQQQQQQQTQARRLSQMQMQMPPLLPQGYEGMGPSQGRRPPSMMMPRMPSPSGQGHGQYAQYLKQGGGSGAY